MIKKEIDQLIKETKDFHQMKTLCLSELDYLNFCVLKHRKRIKIYKGLDVFFTDKIENGTIYLLPLDIKDIKKQLIK